MRRKFDGATKAKVAVAAIKGDKTTAEICSQFGVHSSQVFKWKRKALDEMPRVLSEGASSNATDPKLVDELYQEIGRLKMDLDWLKKRL